MEVANKFMRAIIYEPLPDVNRAPFIRDLYCNLEKLGCSCCILTEEKVIYTIKNKLTKKGVLDNRIHIANFLDGLKVRVFDERRIYSGVDNLNLKEKKSTLSLLRKEWFKREFERIEPDTVYIWNGSHDHQSDIIEFLRDKKCKVVYAEMGWLPQHKHFYLDDKGIHSNSSIASKTFTKPTNSEKSTYRDIVNSLLDNTYRDIKENDKKILVPLQIEGDTNITHHSHYQNMEQFIREIVEWVPSDYNIVFRPHPKDTKSLMINDLPDNCSMTSEGDIYQLILESSIIIGINSTVLIEALALGKKVIAFGQGIFNGCDDVVRIDDFRAVDFSSLKFQDCYRVQFINYLVEERQLSFKELKKVNIDAEKLFLMEKESLPVDIPALRKPLMMVVGRVYELLFKLKYRLKDMF